MSQEIQNQSGGGEGQAMEAHENHEALQERLEILQGIVDQFNKDVQPALIEFENKNAVFFTKENGYDDEQKQTAFTRLFEKLVEFMTHIDAINLLYSRTNSEFSLAPIYSACRYAKERLTAAPSLKHGRAQQIEQHGGEAKNVPGGKGLDTFEHTKEAFIKLKAIIDGVNGSLSFLSPKKAK